MGYRNRAAGLAVLSVLALVVACSKARESTSSGETALDLQCTRCHGGQDNQTGAPPVSIRGGSETADPGVGAHTAHVAAGPLAVGFTCSDCHPDPRTAPGKHRNGTVDVIFGTLARTGNASPTFDAASYGCQNTWCHGKFPGGNAQNVPVWTKVRQGQAACGTCHGDPSQLAPALPPPTSHAQLAPGATNKTCNVCHPATVDANGNVLATGGKHVNGVVDTDPAAKHPDGWLTEGSPAFHGTAAIANPQACTRCHAVSGTGTVLARTCAQCHHQASPSWMDQTSAGFHAYQADRSIAGCTTCHGADLAGGFVGVACAGCHTAGGVASDLTKCTGCHGGTDNATGAPPRTIWPAQTATTVLSVGAHTTHVAGGALGNPLGCEFCHVKPASVFAPGHVDGTATVQGYTGTDATWLVAGKDPGFNPSTGSCATAYCHGAFPGGNTSNAPVWTQVGQGQAACGTCHDTPPPPPHPAVVGVTSCNGCHGDSVDASGAIIPAASGGKHLNGKVDVSGAHPPDWTDTTSPNFHALSAEAPPFLSACQTCHGQDLAGGTAIPGCGSCHDQGLPVGVASWTVNCVMCHGGTDNQTGAPPKATWGHDTDPIRVGAHSSHVTASAIGPAFDCGVCHVKPQDVFSIGHIDNPTATVMFSSIAAQGPGPVPAWDRTTATCTNTYCHGNFNNAAGTTLAGSNFTPVWTKLDGSQGTCGTCHGVPPLPPHPAVGSSPTTCNPCHPNTVDGNGVIIPGGAHLDGQIEVASGHDANWIDPTSPGFHAYAADGGLSSCQYCHGANLDAVGGVSDAPACNQCHTSGGIANDFSTCTGCHGGTDNQTGAPPRSRWPGATATTTLGVGAHTSHVKGLISPPFDCTACHVKPTSWLDVGHVDGAVGVGPYTGSDANLLRAVGDPGWNETTATCSTSYCHGAAPGAALQGGTINTPKWTQVDSTQAACGTCHGIPPPTGRLSQIHNQGDYNPLHVLHVNYEGYSCGSCHPGYPADNGSTNKAIHVDGMVELGNNIIQWDPVAGACLGKCHGTTTWMQWR